MNTKQQKTDKINLLNAVRRYSLRAVQTSDISKAIDFLNVQIEVSATNQEGN